MSNWPTDEENNRRDAEPTGERPVNERETLDELSAGAPASPLTAGEPLTPGAVVPNTISPPNGGNGNGAAPGRQWRWEGRQRRHPAAASLAIVAVVSAIIGGMISLMLFPYVSSYFAPKPQLPAPKSGTGITQTALPNTADPPAVYVAEHVGPAVVTIINRQQGVTIWGRQTEQVTGGTGFIIDPNGYIVTNNHVVEASHGLTVTLSDGRNLEARLIGADAASDLAVIKVDATNLPVAELGDSDQLRVGEVAIAIGTPVDPQAFQRTVTQGVISGLNRKIEQGDRIMTLIQTDAAINPGNSGGPLCNAAGQVIGINVAKIAEGGNVDNIGLSIPVNIARPIINELIATGKVSRVWLGARFAEKQAAAVYYNVRFDQGLLVVEVLADSPAQRAGLQQGDIVNKIDGQAVDRFVELRTALDAKRPGQQVKIDFTRNGRAMSVTATLVAQPDDAGQ
ncbi:MAG: S1C family serine protease [Chloroflexota bacterium]